MVKNKKLCLWMFALAIIYIVLSCLAIDTILTDNIASGIHYEKEKAFLNFFMMIPFCIYFVSVLYISKCRNSIVDTFLLFYLVLYFLPFVAFSASIKTNTVYILYTNLFFISLICIRYFTANYSVRLKNVFVRLKQANHIKKMMSVIILIMISAVVIGIAIYINEFKFNLSLSGVYTIRANYKLKTTFLINVIKNTCGWFAVPLLLLREIKSKRFLTAGWLILMELLLYSLGSDKIYLFLIFVAVCLAVLKNMDAFRLSVVMIAGVIGVLLLSFFIYNRYESNLIYTLVLRRLFVTPEHISNYCFDFFSAHKKIFWRQDSFLIDKFFQPVYSKPYVSIISERYFEGIIPNPTTGVLADSYINFGWLGLIIYPILLVMLLSILNRCTSMLDKDERNLLVLIFTILILDNSIIGSDVVCMMVLIILFLMLLNILAMKRKSN